MNSKQKALFIVFLIFSTVIFGPYLLKKGTEFRFTYVIMPDKRDEEIVRLVVKKPKGILEEKDLYLFGKISKMIFGYGGYEISKHNVILHENVRDIWNIYLEEGTYTEAWERDTELKFYFFSKDNPRSEITFEILYKYITLSESEDIFINYSQWFTKYEGDLSTRKMELIDRYTLYRDKFTDDKPPLFGELDIFLIKEFDETEKIKDHQ